MKNILLSSGSVALGRCVVLGLCLTLTACAAKKQCPNGDWVLSTDACPAATPEQLRKAARERTEAEVKKAVARTQHRLSETAPPQALDNDAEIRDPSLRRNVSRDNRQIHPY